jgi:uncharacterized spore protein YtfJ
METTKEVLETMYDKLDHLLKTETVIGKAITVGDIKLIPIITASFGLGGGVGEEKSKSAGGGGGLGCKISPDAILVINGDEVKMLPVKNKGPLESILAKVPELLHQFESDKKTDSDQNSEKN